MGACLNKKTKIHSAPSTSSYKSLTLSDLSENLSIAINRLHKNSLKCREMLQARLLLNDRASSMFYIFKELIIKRFLENLRELATQVGVSLLSKIDKKTKVELIDYAESQLRDSGQGILDDNFEIFIDNDKKLRKNFMQMFRIDLELYEELERILEQEQEKVKSYGSNGFKRIKYFKKDRSGN